MRISQIDLWKTSAATFTYRFAAIKNPASDPRKSKTRKCRRSHRTPSYHRIPESQIRFFGNFAWCRGNQL